jgi:hypothetical protein
MPAFAGKTDFSQSKPYSTASQVGCERKCNIADMKIADEATAFRTHLKPGGADERTVLALFLSFALFLRPATAEAAQHKKGSNSRQACPICENRSGRRTLRSSSSIKRKKKFLVPPADLEVKKGNDRPLLPTPTSRIDLVFGTTYPGGRPWISWRLSGSGEAFVSSKTARCPTRRWTTLSKPSAGRRARGTYSPGSSTSS